MALRAVSPAGLLSQNRQTTRWARIAAARQHPIADGVNNITAVSGSNTMNCRISCYTHRDASLTDIVLGFPGFYENLPEANMTINFTATASIEYPAGTFTQVRFAGATSQTVTAGYPIYYSDPVPVQIPANTQFWVKCFLSWTGGSVAFPLSSYGVCGTSTEWCTVGTGLSDNTMTTTTLTPTYACPPFQQGSGYIPAVFGRFSTPVPVLGMVGDSIDDGGSNGDLIESVYGGVGFERGMRNVVPVLNFARFAETAANWASRPNGRLALTADAVTHVLIGYGRNDLDNAVSAATLLTRNRVIADYFMSRGVQVYVRTVTPRTTSTDGFITIANQTVHNAGFEAQRIAYNALVRGNFRSYGWTGIFDVSRVVDPGDIGIWNADSGVSGRQAYGVATLTGTAVTAVARPTLSAGTVFGSTGYPASQSALACVVYRTPDDPIRTGDAVITCATDGSGVVTSFSVVSGGSYTYPPMVTPQGIWTYDGTHPTTRSYNAMIAGTGLGPNAFSL